LIWLKDGRETLYRIASILIGSAGYSKIRIEGYEAREVADYFVQSGLSSNVIVTGTFPNPADPSKL